MTDLKLFSADSPEWGAMFMTRNDGGAKTSHDKDLCHLLGPRSTLAHRRMICISSAAYEVHLGLGHIASLVLWLRQGIRH